MKARWRIVAVDDRIDSRDQHIRLFLVYRHHNNRLGRGGFVQNLLHPLCPAKGVCNELEDAEQPWDGEKGGERPEGEPLQGADHGLGIVSSDLGGKREGNDHDGKEDAPVGRLD